MLLGVLLHIFHQHTAHVEGMYVMVCKLESLVMSALHALLSTPGGFCRLNRHVVSLLQICVKTERIVFLSSSLVTSGTYGCRDCLLILSAHDLVQLSRFWLAASPARSAQFSRCEAN